MVVVRFPLTMSVAGSVLALALGGCGGEGSNSDEPSPPAKDTTSAGSSPSPTDDVTSTNPSPTPEPEPALDPADLLVQRDEGGTQPWQEDQPNPGNAESTTSRACTGLMEGFFSDDDDSDAAAIGWFDPTSVNVNASAQVVRVFPTQQDAAEYVTDLKRRLAGCKQWKDGPGEDPGIISRIMFFELPFRLGEQTVSWRNQSDFGVGTTASTWRITARYGNVVSTVDATSLDDVQRLAVKDVRIYADQAGRLILQAQGR